jgi:peptidyl-prolyl cis-trans isomerase SurA
MVHFKPVLAKSLTLLTLACCVCVSFARAETIEKLEASVNSSIILLSDVVKFRETMKLRAQLDPLFTGTQIAADGPNAKTKDIVDFLVDEKLISQLYPATDSEVEQEINSIQSNNHIDREALKHALGEQGFTFEQYFDLIRISLSKRNLIDRDIRTKVSISDDDVKNYFYNHYAKTAAIPMAYKIGLITISDSNYRTSAAAKDVAESALKAIRGGEAFEDVAKRVSDDANAASGGDLGTLAEDQMSPVIREHATKLQVGQVSDVFSGNDSYMILKLSDLKSSDTERLEKMKDEIRNQLFSAETQHQILLWLERQRQDAFIHYAGDPSLATAANPTPAPATPPSVTTPAQTPDHAALPLPPQAPPKAQPSTSPLKLAPVSSPTPEPSTPASPAAAPLPNDSYK